MASHSIDPNNPGQFLRLESLLRMLSANQSRVVSIGIPAYSNSSYLRNTSDAPELIARLMNREEANPFTELDADVSVSQSYSHVGNAAIDPDNEFEQIRSVALAAGKSKRPLFLGGDHSITYPVVSALATLHGRLDIVHIDAHPDLYDDFGGNPYSHASPFARIMENNLAHRLEQFAIRTLTPHQREQVERFGVVCHEMKDRRRWPAPSTVGPTYVTIDLDGLDPSCAPGVAHRQPGGLSVREVLDLIHSIRAPIIGADIVEYHPARDIDELTALAAATLAREITGVMLNQA